MKICNKCGEERTLSDFSTDKGKKDGLRTICKTCDTARSTNSFKIKRLITLCRDETPTLEQKNVWDGIGMWAKAHDCCVECNQTIFKHKGHGVCSRCYSRLRQSPSDSHSSRVKRAEKNKTRQKKAKKVYYKKIQKNYIQAVENFENEKPQVKNLINSINNQ